MNKTLGRWTIILVSAVLTQGALSSVSLLPGPDVPSPSGRYVLRNVDYEHKLPAHALFLTDKQTNATIKLYNYPRHGSIAWSSDSAHFFINDDYASDQSDCLLFTLQGNKVTLVSLRKALKNQLPEMTKFLNDAASYMDAAGWLNTHSLRVRLYGWDDTGSDFNFWYDYDLKNGFQRNRSMARS